MSTNINPTMDWVRVLSSEVKKLEAYVKVDPDHQWALFKHNVASNSPETSSE